MLVILFRSKPTDQAGEDYAAMGAEMESLVRKNPGFIDVKYYSSDDGEQLAIVWWKDEESLRAWREQERHRIAQDSGRKLWYEYYNIEVANVIRQSNFARE
ncbi:MAG TPA: antibiotic biosynthesis monooxygenase [Candidatus Angelobacter sp.]|nr:antibiotic biosynthesis monooxygenase [Candidatus Angelobacter sp.]